jgi:5-methylcytosine-specific restriction endonuclease McrA
MKKRYDRRWLVDTEYERTCTSCGLVLPTEAFYSSATATKWCCKKCIREHARLSSERRGIDARRKVQKAYYERNREKACAVGQEYRSRPDVKEDRRLKAKLYRQQTKERRRAYLRLWYQQNPERARDAYRRSAGTRRARMADIVTERFTYQEIFERDGGRCRYCGRVLDPAKWHLDHIIPVSAGGPHIRANVCASCPACNMWKKDRLGVEALLHPEVIAQARPSEAEDWTKRAMEQAHA